MTAGRNRFAQGLSLVLNPSLWSGGLVAFVARQEGTGRAAIVQAAIGFLAVAAVPLAIVVHRTRTGRLRSVEMPVRDERHAVYLGSAASFAVGAAVLAGLGASWRLWGLVGLQVVAALALDRLNVTRKVSIHAAGLAGMMAAGLVIVGPSAGGLAVVAVGGCWARWASGAHTPGELAAGAAVGGGIAAAGLLALRTLLG